MFEEGGPPLVDRMVVVWWLYGGCAMVVRLADPIGRKDRVEAPGLGATADTSMSRRAWVGPVGVLCVRCKTSRCTTHPVGVLCVRCKTSRCTTHPPPK
jgi:hypothetical protein